MILISFEDLQKIHNFSKLQGCGSKIGSATPIWISKFKRAWQAQFLSYNLETLEKWVFFEDVQMILVSFFHIPTGFQLRKNAFKSSVHILRRPWLGTFLLSLFSFGLTTKDPTIETNKPDLYLERGGWSLSALKKTVSHRIWTWDL